MGVSQSGIRNVSFANPNDAQAMPIFVSTKVLDKLKQHQSTTTSTAVQPPPQPTPPATPEKVPDVGGACCCLHVPLHRPPVTEAQVHARLEQVERLAETVTAEWQRRDQVRMLSDECVRIRQLLIDGYLANVESTLTCAQLGRDYVQCLQQHRERWRENRETTKSE